MLPVKNFHLSLFNNIHTWRESVVRMLSRLAFHDLIHDSSERLMKRASCLAHFTHFQLRSRAFWLHSYLPNLLTDLLASNFSFLSPSATLQVLQAYTYAALRQCALFLLLANIITVSPVFHANPCLIGRCKAWKRMPLHCITLDC